MLEIPQSEPALGLKQSMLEIRVPPLSLSLSLSFPMEVHTIRLVTNVMVCTFQRQTHGPMANSSSTRGLCLAAVVTNSNLIFGQIS